MSDQTVFQLRLTVEQKERWRAAANGVSLSEWIRQVCDLATEEARLKKLSSLPVRVPTEGLLEPEPVIDNFHRDLSTPNPAGVSWPMLPPEDEHAVLGVPLERVSLAPDCVNKHLHWALKQGEPCRFCKGTL